MRQRKTTQGLRIALWVACLILGSVACAGTAPAESPVLTAGVTAPPPATPVPPTDTVAPASPTVQEPTDQVSPTPETPTQDAVPTRAEVEETAEPSIVPTVRPSETVPEGSEADRMVAAAKADLAARLGLSEAEITVQSAEPVEWPDASLGCPQPGMMYAQVITPGYRVLLAAQGQAYEYHTARANQVILCQPEEGSEMPSPKGIKDGQPWQPVEPIEPGSVSPTPNR